MLQPPSRPFCEESTPYTVSNGTTTLACSNTPNTPSIHYATLGCPNKEQSLGPPSVLLCRLTPYSRPVCHHAAWYPAPFFSILLKAHPRMWDNRCTWYSVSKSPVCTTTLSPYQSGIRYKGGKGGKRGSFFAIRLSLSLSPFSPLTRQSKL